MKISDFADEFGLAQADVVNWITRLELRTSLKPTTRGAARRFSRQNVVELAAIGALVSVGIRPSDAVIWAEIVVDDYRNPVANPMKWLVFPAGRFDMAEQTNCLDPESLDHLAARSPFRAVVHVEVGSIPSRVDALFEERNLAQESA